MYNSNRNPCIYSLLIILLLATSFTGAEDAELELLDKEYGVRYASACEGR